MSEDKRAIDVDYVEVKDSFLSSDEIIDGIYYNAVQVSKILNENDSTIRHWAKEFKDILDIKSYNGMKRYSKTDIENLKFIQKLLRIDGYSIKQAYDYCFAKGFNGEEGLIDANNHLAIKVLINALSDDMSNNIALMQNNLIKQQEQFIINLKEQQMQREKDLLSEISLTVDEVVTEKIEAFKEEYESKRQEDMELRQRELDMYNDLRNRLDNKKQENEKKQGFFSRLIGRK